MIFILKGNSNLNIFQGCSSWLFHDWSLLTVTLPVCGHPSQIGQPQTGSSSPGAILPVDGDNSLPDLLGHALSDAGWMLFASSAMRANCYTASCHQNWYSACREQNRSVFPEEPRSRWAWVVAYSEAQFACVSHAAYHQHRVVPGPKTLLGIFKSHLPTYPRWYLIPSSYTEGRQAVSCSASRPEFNLPSSYKLLKYCLVVSKLVPTEPDPVRSLLQGISHTSWPNALSSVPFASCPSWLSPLGPKHSPHKNPTHYI